jgi:hypothetical protein
MKKQAHGNRKWRTIQKRGSESQLCPDVPVPKHYHQTLNVAFSKEAALLRVVQVV